MTRSTILAASALLIALGCLAGSGCQSNPQPLGPGYGGGGAYGQPAAGGYGSPHAAQPGRAAPQAQTRPGPGGAPPR